MESGKIFVTLNEACRVTGIAVYSLRRGCRERTIPHIMQGQKYLINLPQLLDALNKESARNGRRGEA